MDEVGVAKSPVNVRVRNVGGIAETTVAFTPGVTILTGRNATNRTSFLRAIMAALGSEAVDVKSDTEEGSVELELGGDVYTRSLSRHGGTTVFDGDPYLDDTERSNQFAFLLESNDARQAIERGGDLYDVIMRPVDTNHIDAKVDQCEAEQAELEAELEALDPLEAKLPELEAKREQLESDIEAKREHTDSKRAELDALEIDAKTQSELEGRLGALRDTRNDLEDVRNAIEDERGIVDALRDDEASVESDLDGLATVDDADVTDLEATVRSHRESIQSIESMIADLQSVIKFNESLLEGNAAAFIDSIRDEARFDSEDSVTDRLVSDEAPVHCWTCGSQVSQSEVERTLELLQDVHNEKVAARNALRDEVAELEAERKHIERTRDEYRRLQERLEQTRTDIEKREANIVQLEAEADELEAEVAGLETEIEALESDDHDELLSLHREVNESEFELDRLESRLDEVEGEIESIAARLEERGQLEAQLSEIEAEIESLRSRIGRLERESVEQFNEQMEVILDLLEYDNLERVWIERIQTEVKQGRRKEQQTTFDLHVIRTTDSGAVYEDSIDHLSESEREVVGLMFALSGYLVHEVYEQLPFMLLDSIEAFDSDRISALVDHFSQYADYLVVALLPEDAAALDDDYQRITEI